MERSARDDFALVMSDYNQKIGNEGIKFVSVVTV